jgi:hypothetical protein
MLSGVITESQIKSQLCRLGGKAVQQKYPNAKLNLNTGIHFSNSSLHTDKDFKLFTHDGVTVERVGYSGGLVDISADFERIIKNIYVGLQVPSVLMDGVIHEIQAPCIIKSNAGVRKILYIHHRAIQSARRVYQ